MRLIWISLFLAAPAFCQNYYTVSKTSALSGAAEVVTVQQPASALKFVRFSGAYIDCTAACSFTLEVNGTVAANTALTVASMDTKNPTAVTTAFYDSDSTTATVIGRYSIAAGGGLSIDLKNVKLNPGTRNNLTLRSNSITGTVDITILFAESNT